MPPSKMCSDDGYDDRLIQVLNILKNHCPVLDVRNILFSKKNREPAHVSHGKRAIEYYKENMEVIFQKSETPVAQVVVIFDDFITTGAQFKAAKALLQSSFPETTIVGLFIARNNPALHLVKVKQLE